jgi:O-antigen ligase
MDENQKKTVMKYNLQNYRESSFKFLIISIFFLLIFLGGGGSRADILSLLIIRPVSIALLAVGIWTVTSEQIKRHRVLLGLAMSTVFLSCLYLIPLPPFIWQLIPGREIIANVDKIAALPGQWRPLAMEPTAGLNSLFSLTVPAAALVAMIQLSEKGLRKLLSILVVLALFSGFVGLLQVIGAFDEMLYFYAQTNRGSAVGLFANRNHQAFLLACLFPMLAAFATQAKLTPDAQRIRSWIAAGGAVFLIPLILVTGSRAGLVLGLIGLGLAAALYRRPQALGTRKRSTLPFDPRYIFAALAILGLGLLTVLMSRAEAVSRLLATDSADQSRSTMWEVGSGLAHDYFPFGSGFGSIIEVYQIAEPQDTLDTTYVNHLHNDWLEIVVTGGLPALILLGVGLILYAKCTWHVWRERKDRSDERRLGQLGTILIFMAMLGSIVDYPLRVPSIMILAAVAAVWMSAAINADPSEHMRTAKRDGIE